LGNTERLTHAHRLMRSQRARTHAALVTTTVHLRLEAHARLAANVESADAFRAVGLVGGEGHQVDLHLLQIDFHLARGLGRIDMEQHAAGTGQFTDGGDIVNGADLVVHMHDGHQHGVLAQSGLDHFRRDHAVFARLDVSNLDTFALQLAGGIQHRLVFDLAGDDVLALGGVEVGNALDGKVVGFGRARGPDDFPRVGIDQLGHLATRILHRFLGSPAKGMRARGGVAEVAVGGQALDHLLGHARVDRRCSGVVQVNRQFHQVSPIRLSSGSFDGGRFDLFQLRGTAIGTTHILAQRNLLHLAPVDQIGQADATEEFVNLLTQVAPEVVSQAGIARMTVAEPLATSGINGFVDRIDYLDDLYVGHLTGQLIATTRPANAGYQAATAQLGE